MIFLDERITFGFTLTGTLPTAGVYKYEMYQYKDVAPTGETLVFVGNFYYDGTSSVKLDMTDIIRSTKVVVPNSIFTDSNTHYHYNTDLINRFKVKIYFSNSNIKDSGWKEVAKVYRIPTYTTSDFVSDYHNDGWDIYWQSFTANRMQERIALQGSKVSGNALALVPHYPLVWTDNYSYAQAFSVGNLLGTISLSITGGEHSETVSLSTADRHEGTLVSIPIGEFIDWAEDWGTSDLRVIDTTNSSNKTIAIFDNCYKRYYLFWQDRMGGYQSQAFNDTAKYSESFNTTETQDYQNTRKKSNIQVQPKWQLNSGWIAENLFPLYESIYVSPVLLLYDSQCDRLYEVIINSDYVEKTYKSEKKLLNLNLELEASTKQNIFY